MIDLRTVLIAVGDGHGSCMDGSQKDAESEKQVEYFLAFFIVYLGPNDF